MARGSRRREKPRKQTLHSLADQAIAKRMVRSEVEADPETFAAAEALLERARIENIRELSTLDELDHAADTLITRPLKLTGSYFRDLEALLEWHQVIGEYRARIKRRRKHLTKKNPQLAAA